MNVASFLDSLDPEDRVNVEKYRTEILKIDTKVKEKVSKIMSIENALVYEQDGVFKYGLAKTKHHYTFHSMVMYGNEDILKFVKQNMKGAKIQKGCVNFKSFSDFPIDLFRELMGLSAEKDFTPVIEHYQKKKK